MKPLHLFLDAESFVALQQLSEKELRDPRSQAVLIIRRELKRRGLLASDPKKGAGQC